MKNYILTILLLILFGEVAYLYKINTTTAKTEVLAVKVEAVVTASTEPTPTVSPTPVPTPIITPKPTQTPRPVPVFSSQQIYEFTNRFAGQYGVDPNVIRHLAQCESGFNPMAKYHIYEGLFQFDAATWKNLRIKMGEDPSVLRTNAEEAVQTAAFAVSIGSIGLWPNCMP